MLQEAQRALPVNMSRDGVDTTPTRPPLMPQGSNVLPGQRVSLATQVSLLYFAVYLHYGIFTTFLPLWFKSKGLGAGEIGILLAIPLFLRLLVAAPVANLADRLRRIREVLFVCLALAALAMASMMILSGFWSLVILFTLMALAWDPAPVLTDGYAAAAVRTASLDFGRLRLWGSLAFIASSLTAGQIIAWSDVAVVPMLLAGALTIPLLVIPLLTPDRSFGSGVRAVPGEWRALLNDRHLIVVLVAGAVILASHAIVNSFGAIRWQEQGLSVSLIGVLTSVAIGAEVIVLWFAQRLLGSRAPSWLVLIGGIAAVSRWIVMSFDPGVMPLMALQLLNGVSAMATIVGVMLTIAARTPAHLMATANGLNTVLIGLGQALVTLLAGQLWGWLGASAYLTMAFAAALACALLATAGRQIPQA